MLKKTLVFLLAIAMTMTSIPVNAAELQQGLEEISVVEDQAAEELEETVAETEVAVTETETLDTEEEQEEVTATESELETETDLDAAAEPETTTGTFGHCISLGIYYPDNGSALIPGEEKCFGTELFHEWNLEDGSSGMEKTWDYVVSIDTDSEGDPAYDTDLVEVRIDADGRTLIVTAKEGYGETLIPVTASLDVEGVGTLETQESIYVSVAEAYTRLDLGDFDTDRYAGIAQTFVPEVILCTLDENGQKTEETMDGTFRYEISYDSDFLEVKDKDGNVVNGYVEANALPLTVVRKYNFGFSFTVAAEEYNEEDDEWDPVGELVVNMNEHSEIGIHFDNINEWSTTDFFIDQDLEVTAEAVGAEAYQADELSWVWEVKSCGLYSDEYSPADLNEGFEINGNGIILKGSELAAQIDPSSQGILVRASLMIGEIVLAWSEFTAAMLEEENEIYYPFEDQIMTVNHVLTFESEFYGRIRNSEYPEGREVAFSISEVIAVNGEDSTPDNPVCEVSFENGYYEIRANAYGEADIIVTYLDEADTEGSYSFHITVQPDVFELQDERLSDSAYMLINSVQEFRLRLEHCWYYSEEEQGRESIENDQYRIEVLADVPGITVTVDEEEKLLTVCSSDQMGVFEIPIAAVYTMNAGSDEAYEVRAERSVMVYVTDNYVYLDGVETNLSLSVGESAQISPVVRYVYVDENGDAQETIWTENIRFRILFDPEAVQVKDSEGNILDSDSVSDAENAVYTIERMANIDTEIRINSECYDSENDTWSDFCSETMYLCQENYEIAFDSMRGGWDYTWIFDGETQTIGIDPDCDLLNRIPEDELTWEWKVTKKYNDEDMDQAGTEITDPSCWYVNDSNQIVLDGTALCREAGQRSVYCQIDVAAVKNGHVIAEHTFYCAVMSACESFLYPIDNDTVTMDTTLWIPAVFSGYIRNKDYSDGMDYDCTITDITCEDLEGEDLCTISEEEDEWRIEVENLGACEITIHFTDYAGEERTYSVILNVDTDVLLVNRTFEQNVNDMLPESVKEIRLTASHEWYYDDEDCGYEELDDFTVSFVDDEGNPMYDEDLVSVSLAEDGKTILVNSGQQTGDTEIGVIIRYTAYEGTEYERVLEKTEWIELFICESYFVLENLDTDITLLKNETCTLAPELWCYYIGEEGCASEHVDRVRYCLDYAEDGLEVTDGDGNQIPSGEVTDSGEIHITRLNDDDAYFFIRAEYLYEDMGEWAEVASCDLWFPYHEHSEVIDESVEPTYTRTGLTEGSHCEECGEILVPQEVIPAKKLEAPAVTLANASTGIKVSWKAVKGATGYLVYRLKDGKYSRITTITSGSTVSFSDTAADTSGTAYTYKVYATVTMDDGTVNKTGSAAAKILKLANPAIKLSSASTGIKVSWEQADGATGYWVYRGSTRIAVITSGSTVVYSDTEANTSGTTYSYKVYAIGKNPDGSSVRSGGPEAVSILKLGRPAVTLANASTGVKISWKAIKGATGYYVYRGSTKVATISSGSTVTYTDTAAKTNGTKYTYKVYAKSGSTKSAASAAESCYFLTRPAISGLTNSAAGTLKVTWGKNSKATGYQIKYVTGTTSKTVSVSGYSTVSKAISGLKKGSTYKVYVRSYKTVSGTKYYSAWSAAKSLKLTR